MARQTKTPKDEIRKFTMQDMANASAEGYRSAMENVKPVLDELDELLKVIGDTNGPRVLAVKAALYEFRRVE
ncbi:hypothetical protein D3C76_407130 [compost metagenome]